MYLLNAYYVPRNVVAISHEFINEEKVIPE